jgi:hypothetical protein
MSLETGIKEERARNVAAFLREESGSDTTFPLELFMESFTSYSCLHEVVRERV